MLQEYALDPVVFSDWQSFRYFFENFGVSQGKMIVQYPKKWKRLVYEACTGCRDIERSRIEQRLADIDDKLLRTQCIFDPAMSWFANAEMNRAAFKAVISNDNPNRYSEILVADLLDDSHPLWQISREKTVARTAHAMADCAGRLLEHSRDILFVDPHFDPTKSRYRNTLKAFLERIIDYGKVRRIEYHLSNRLPASFFGSELMEKIPRILKQGVTVTFIRWEEKYGGDSLHPRYILTDLGGIRFEHGLDEEPTGPTVDVSLLDTQLYKTRWKDYQKDATSFVYVDEFKVTGTR